MEKNNRSTKGNKESDRQRSIAMPTEAKAARACMRVYVCVIVSIADKFLTVFRFSGSMYSITMNGMTKELVRQIVEKCLERVRAINHFSGHITPLQAAH